MLETIKKLAVEEDGADATEYALLAALVAVALIGGATFLGGKINNLFNGVGNKVNVTIP
jgi:pilus assembly protein Flp/PilA